MFIYAVKKTDPEKLIALLIMIILNNISQCQTSPLKKVRATQSSIFGLMIFSWKIDLLFVSHQKINKYILYNSSFRSIRVKIYVKFESAIIFMILSFHVRSEWIFRKSRYFSWKNTFSCCDHILLACKTLDSFVVRVVTAMGCATAPYRRTCSATFTCMCTSAWSTRYRH